MLQIITWKKKVKNNTAVYTPKKYVSDQLYNQLISYFNKNLINKVLALINENSIKGIVLENNHKVFASTDFCKSYSLFYRLENNKLSLSDSVNNLSKNLSLEILRSDFEVELMMSGYMSENKTVFQEIYQLRCGEYLFYNKNKGILKTSKYFSYLREQKEIVGNKKSNKLKLDRILNKIFSKIIEQSNKHKVVVTLSGGWDSRLIIAKLHSLGCRNLIAVTYGPKNNEEAIIARKVCERLNLDWKYVELDGSDYRKFFLSKKRKEYWLSCDFFSCLPNNQDYLVMSKLIKECFLDKNSIILNGQTGDFISGGHIPDNLLNGGESKKKLYEEIIKKNFSLWTNYLSDKNLIKIKKILEEKFMKLKEFRYSDAELYEYWEFEERQSKFILNGQRIYDFLELKWELPYWNYEFVNFWRNVPLRQKKNAILYKEYLLKWDYKGLFTEIHRPRSGWSLMNALWIASVSKVLKLFFPKEVQENFVHRVKYLDRLNHHYSSFGMKQFLKHSKQIRNPNSLYVLSWIKDIKQILNENTLLNK